MKVTNNVYYWNYYNAYRPDLMPLSRLESYKRIVSVSSRNQNISSRFCLGWWNQHLGVGRWASWSRLGLEL